MLSNIEYEDVKTAVQARIDAGEDAQVLPTASAIKGKVARLVGLEENVIIGKLIPSVPASWPTGITSQALPLPAELQQKRLLLRQNNLRILGESQSATRPGLKKKPSIAELFQLVDQS